MCPTGPPHDGADREQKQAESEARAAELRRRRWVLKTLLEVLRGKQTDDA